VKQASLRCWYVSIVRMLELVSAKGSNSQELYALQNSNEQWSRIFLANTFGKSLLEEIERRMVPPLQSLAAEGRIQKGQDFILNSTYQGKGFGASNRGQSVSLSSNISEFSDRKKLLIEFSKSGLITDTAYSRLNERANLFVYGSVTEVSGETVKAVPYVVADLIERDDEVGLDLPIYNNPYTPPSAIDQFSGVDFNAAVDEPTFRKLKDVPENIVKEFLAKLLGEFDPPKDWGGEQCDLYTGNISIAGQQLRAAFLLKGPSCYHEMTMRDCGAKADQIYRLFCVPADLYIVQHCHRIGPAVSRTVDAYAHSRVNSRVRYTLIDGYATARLLLAHGVI